MGRTDRRRTERQRRLAAWTNLAEAGLAVIEELPETVWTDQQAQVLDVVDLALEAGRELARRLRADRGGS